MRAILTYHSIDPSGSPVSIHPDTFRRHVAWLASGRVSVTTIDALVEMPDDADAVAITFDDAFENFATIAAPQLVAHRFPVTLFVVSDEAGRTNAWDGRSAGSVPELPLLDWPALARLVEEGVTLGAHTRTHPDLARVDRHAAEDQILGCAETIERRTGTRPPIFAYPYGSVTETARSIAAANFRFACTTDFRLLSSRLDPALLPRIDMYYFRDPVQLERWGTARFERLVAARHLLRRVRRWIY